MDDAIRKQVKNSWDKASNTIDEKMGHWAIDIPCITDDNMSADGIIYSPAGDVQRPYPIFYLKFNLCWKPKSGFEMKLLLNDNGNRNLSQKYPELKKTNFFIFDDDNKKIYYKLKNNESQTNVSDFLESVYDNIFPKNPTQVCQTVGLWLSAIKDIFRENLKD